MINWYDKVNIIRPDLSGYRRIIAVSDIHANLDYFQHLLEKIEFGKEDALIIAGDFLEKGERSLDTLHLIMDMVLCRCRQLRRLDGHRGVASQQR